MAAAPSQGIAPNMTASAHTMHGNNAIAADMNLGKNIGHGKLIHGAIPKKVMNLTQLKTLGLGNNKMTGVFSRRGYNIQAKWLNWLNRMFVQVLGAGFDKIHIEETL